MIEKKQCVFVKELLPLYQDDSLTNECQEAVKEHLSECAPCAQLHSKMRNEHQEVNPSILDSSGTLGELEDQQMGDQEAMSKQEANEDIIETLRFQKVAKRLKRRRIRMVIITIASCLFVLMVYRTLFETHRIGSNSMQPTISSGDNLFFSKASYWFSSPERGDIVLISNRSEQYSTLVKRVVAIPGDVILIQQGKLYVNGNLYQTNSYMDEGDMGNKKLTVKEGEYFVIGDNVSASIDSRSNDVGCIKESYITAKYLFTLPFSNPLIQTEVTNATSGNQ